MSLITAHQAVLTNRGLTQLLWADLPITDAQKDPTSLIDLFDDFTNVPAMNSATQVLDNKYTYISSTGVVINQVDDAIGLPARGVLELNVDSDNDIAAVQAHGGAFFISDTAGDERKLWLEARVSLAQLTAQNVFIGLAERDMTAAATTFVGATGVFADVDYVGFRIQEAAPSEWDAVHRITGGGGEVVVKNIAQTAVADTYYKFGLMYEPIRQNPLDGKILRYYVNGVEVGSIVTALPATFPDAIGMAPLFLMGAAGAVRDARCDWWKTSQVA